MIQNEVVYEYIENYIRTMQPKFDEKVEKIRKEAMESHVPIVKPEVASLISTILSIKKPSKVLEVGAAVGFSAIIMSKYAEKIVTIERDEIMYKKANENIKNMGLESRIEVLFGDALDILQNIKDKYDVIFIDAAKGQYNSFYKHCLPLLNSEGIIIADNSLYKGIVAKEEGEVDRRNRTIHKRMREFIENIMNNKDFESTLIPVGDGIIISKKLA